MGHSPLGLDLGNKDDAFIIHEWTGYDIKCQHTLPGEPMGEWVPDSDEEPEGFLGTSLVFWDMKRVRILPRKNMTFQQSTFMTRMRLKTH